MIQLKEWNSDSSSGPRSRVPTRPARNRWLKALGLGTLLAVTGSMDTALIAQNTPLAIDDVLHGYPGYLLGPTALSQDTPSGAAGNYSVDFGRNGGSGIIVSNATFLNLATTNDVMTFSLWVKKYDIAAASGFWADSPSSNNGERGFQAHIPWSDDTIYFDTAGCCDSGLQRINANINSFGPYQTIGNDTFWNVWHHFVFLKNGADKQVWIDGQLFLEGSNTAPLPTDMVDLWIGNGSAGTLPMHGLIDDFTVYSTALSSSNIALLADGGSPTNLAGESLLAYWSFDNPAPIGPLVGTPLGFSYTFYNTSARVLNPATVALTLNGSAVTATSVTTVGSIVTINYLLPNPPFTSGSTNAASFAGQDTHGNSYSGSGTFVVPPFATIAAGWAVTGVDTNLPGFRLLPWQSGAEPNADYWMEEQLEGLHGTNNAYVSTTTADGFIEFNGVINFNINPAQQGGGDDGNFQSSGGYDDALFPGIPGANGLNGSSSLMALTYLQFSKAGLYTMGVNSDDGFAVTAGPQPRDRLATVCGSFNGGRGSSDSTFQLYVASAGIYPFCLRWENGNGELPGNGANLEWFMVTTNGTKILINDPDPTNTTGVAAFYKGPAATAYVSQLNPYPGQTGAWPDRVLLQLTDGATQVKSGLTLQIDGVATSPTVSKQGAVTTVSLIYPTPGLSAGPHTATLLWSDTGTLNASNSWSFVVGKFPTLYQSMSSPVSSVDTTKPGMVLKVTQLDPSTVGDNGDVTGNNVEENNAHLAGLYFPDYGTNQVDTLGIGGGIPAAFDNIWYWTNVVDFNLVTSAGDFTNDLALPGIPGLTSSLTCIAAGFQTYLVFPSPGFYRMGVSSDDGFRITEGIGITRQALHVTGPGIDRDVVGVLNSTNDAAGWGGALPTTPIIAPAVYLDANAACPNLPSGNLTNKIGIIEYNTCGHSAMQAAYCVQTNGGIAAIIVNQPGYGLPFMEGNTGPVTIPVFIVNGRGADGGSGELDFWSTNSLTVSIGADLHLKLDESNEGRGMGDTDSGFWVPAAGTYPIRMLYYQGNGGAGCEWSTIIPGVTVDGGTRSLVNDVSDANSIKAFRAVKTLPSLNPPTVGGGLVTITWQGAGVLQSSPTIHPANWVTVNPQPGNNSYSVPVTSAPNFYRVMVPNPVTP